MPHTFFLPEYKGQGEGVVFIFVCNCNGDYG